MSWSYNTAFPTDRDKVRFLIGDTDSTAQQLSNEEINGALDLEANLYMAAAMCARALEGKYAREADKWVGDLKVLASQKSERYAELASRLEKKKRTHQVPFAGGISVAGKDALLADTDWPPTSFTRGMHDNEE